MFEYSTLRHESSLDIFSNYAGNGAHASVLDYKGMQCVLPMQLQVLDARSILIHKLFVAKMSSSRLWTSYSGDLGSWSAPVWELGVLWEGFWGFLLFGG